MQIYSFPLLDTMNTRLSVTSRNSLRTAQILVNLINDTFSFCFVSQITVSPLRDNDKTTSIFRKDSRENFPISETVRVDKCLLTAGQIKILCKNRKKPNCTNRVKVCVLRWKWATITFLSTPVISPFVVFACYQTKQ